MKVERSTLGLAGMATFLLLLGLLAHGPLAAQLPGWLARALLLAGMLGLVASVLGHCLPSRREDSSSTRALHRRYLRELLPAMAIYLLLLALSVWLLRRVEATALRALLAVLPALPIAFVLRAFVRYLRGADELQRRIQLEAVCVATGFVSMAYLTAGLLQAARVIDVPAEVAMIWVFPLVCASHGVAVTVLSRRYL